MDSFDLGSELGQLKEKLKENMLTLKKGNSIAWWKMEDEDKLDIVYLLQGFIQDKLRVPFDWHSISKIDKCMDDICEQMFSYMDIITLSNAELVSKVWKNAIRKGNVWKKL